MRSYLPTTALIIVTGAGDAVAQRLAVTEAGPPQRVCLAVPGEIAWDECDCGQLAQTITSTYASSKFPTPATDSATTPCGPHLIVVNVTMSLLRCAPGPGVNGKSPACAALLTAARLLESDRQVMITGVMCYLRELYGTFEIGDFSVGQADTVGPQGACVGSQLTYRFALQNVCC